MDARELLRMNTPKLREEAMKIPGIVGVSAMKKEELIKLLAKAHGIEFTQRTASAEKTVIKQRIRALKAQRDEALARKAYKELKQIRRGIRTLKRRTRALARAAKMDTATSTAQAS